MNEGQILAAMATATHEDRIVLHARLTALRATGSTNVPPEPLRAAQGTPGGERLRHSAATDWLGKVGSERPQDELRHLASAEAVRWLNTKSAMVRGDVNELTIQATGYADLWAGQFGQTARTAKRAFIAALSRVAEISDPDTTEPVEDYIDYFEEDRQKRVRQEKESSSRTAARDDDWTDAAGITHCGWCGRDVNRPGTRMEQYADGSGYGPECGWCSNTPEAASWGNKNVSVGSRTAAAGDVEQATDGRGQAKWIVWETANSQAGYFDSAEDAAAYYADYVQGHQFTMPAPGTVSDGWTMGQPWQPSPGVARPTGSREASYAGGVYPCARCGTPVTQTDDGWGTFVVCDSCIAAEKARSDNHSEMSQRIQDWRAANPGATSDPEWARYSSRTASAQSDAVHEFSLGLRDINVGDRIGDAVVTDVGSQTVQFLSDNGYSSAIQITFSTTTQDENGTWQQNMTPGWDRAVRSGSRTAAFPSTDAEKAWFGSPEHRKSIQDGLDNWGGYGNMVDPTVDKILDELRGWMNSGGGYEDPGTNSGMRFGSRTAARYSEIEQWCDQQGVVMKDFPDSLIEQAADSGDMSVLDGWLATNEPRTWSQGIESPDPYWYASKHTAAGAADGDTSACRICGRAMEAQDYVWYALSASAPQRMTPQHYCIPARLQARPGEFGPDGVLVPGLPGGEGGQYDAPAGTIFDNGGNPIKIASRRTAAKVCSECGDEIESHGDGYHHNSGTKHDHEAKPGSEKESALNTLSPDDLRAEQVRVEEKYIGRRFQRVTDGVQGTATAAQANSFGGNPVLTVAWDDGVVSNHGLAAIFSLGSSRRTASPYGDSKWVYVDGSGVEHGWFSDADRADMDSTRTPDADYSWRAIGDAERSSMNSWYNEQAYAQSSLRTAGQSWYFTRPEWAGDASGENASAQGPFTTAEKEEREGQSYYEGAIWWNAAKDAVLGSSSAPEAWTNDDLYKDGNDPRWGEAAKPSATEPTQPTASRRASIGDDAAFLVALAEFMSRNGSWSPFKTPHMSPIWNEQPGADVAIEGARQGLVSSQSATQIQWTNAGIAALEAAGLSEHVGPGYRRAQDAFVQASRTAAGQMITTADGMTVGEGARVFDYYDGHWGTIKGIGSDGWFDHVRDGGGTGMLNGERVAVNVPRSNPYYDVWAAGKTARRTAADENAQSGEGVSTLPYGVEPTEATDTIGLGWIEEEAPNDDLQYELSKDASSMWEGL